MNEQLSQDLYQKLMDFPGDTGLVTLFVVSQAKAIHDSRRHESYGDRAGFDSCGVRWCVVARRVAGMTGVVRPSRAAFMDSEVSA